MADKITLTIEMDPETKKVTTSGPTDGGIYFHLIAIAIDMYWARKRNEANKKPKSNIIVPTIVPGPFLKQ